MLLEAAGKAIYTLDITRVRQSHTQKPKMLSAAAEDLEISGLKIRSRSYMYTFL